MSEESTDPTPPADAEQAPAKPAYDDSKTAVFDMRESRMFRTVHADGIWCSKAPRGLVHLMFYVERYQIPNRTYYDLNNGMLGNEQVERRDFSTAYLREVEVATVLDRNALAALHSWIGTYLEETQTEPNHVPLPV